MQNIFDGSYFGTTERVIVGEARSLPSDFLSISSGDHSLRLLSKNTVCKLAAFEKLGSEESEV